MNTIHDLEKRSLKTAMKAFKPVSVRKATIRPPSLSDRIKSTFDNMSETNATLLRKSIETSTAKTTLENRIMKEIINKEELKHKGLNKFTTSPFGADRATGRHKGVDLKLAEGNSLLAPFDGTVYYAHHTEHGPGGIQIAITKADGSMTVAYAHCSSLSPLFPGNKVNKGEEIAKSGSTGRVTGPHLHLHMYDDSFKKIDPTSWLATHPSVSPAFDNR